MTTAQQDFETKIPQGIEQNAAILRKVGATVQVTVEGEGGGDWTIEMNDNLKLKAEATADADGKFFFTPEAWADFMKDPNTVTPLFMTGKLKVEGTAVWGLKLQYLVPKAG